MKPKSKGDRTKRNGWKTLPLRVSNHNNEIIIDLVLYEGHYILMKNPKAWLVGELNYKLRGNEDFLICRRCLNYCLSEDEFKLHYDICVNNSPTKYIFPTERDKELKFTKYEYKLRVPFVMVSDIECINKKFVDEDGEEQIQQIPSHVFVKLISDYPNVLEEEERLFEGKNCFMHFVEYLAGIYDRVNNALKTKIKYIPDEPGDSFLINKITECYMCEKKLQGEKEIFHDCYNGKYLGMAHYDCYPRGRCRNIPIYFHNGSRYDFHYIVKNIAKYVNLEEEKEVGDIFSIIPKTDETYISFNYKKYLNL